MSCTPCIVNTFHLSGLSNILYSVFHILSWPNILYSALFHSLALCIHLLHITFLYFARLSQSVCLFLISVKQQNNYCLVLSITDIGFPAGKGLDEAHFKSQKHQTFCISLLKTLVFLVRQSWNTFLLLLLQQFCKSFK